MAVIVAQGISSTPLTPVYSAVSASDTFLPDDDLIYVVKNGGGSPDTVAVVDASTTQAGNASANLSFSVPAAGERWLYVNRNAVNPNTGFITVTHSFTTSVTAGLYRA
jgi:hypothetical protein